MSTHRFAVVTAVAVALAGPTLAAEYPAKPVTLVVPYGPGGASDLAGRALAEVARGYLGQPVTVQNQPGAGGMNGARAVSDGTPDGYTLLLARVGMALAPAVTPDSAVPYDAYPFLGPLKATPMILAVKADSAFKSVDDLLADIKANPGRLSYAASGATAIDGITVQAMLLDAGLDPLTAATLVPYKGGGELATSLLGGHVQFLAIAAGSLMPHIESGDMRALGVFAPERMEALPDVPTMAELGFAQAGQVTGWSALYGPKDLPQEVTAKWADVLAKVGEDKTWLDQAENRGSISTIGKVDISQYATEQYQLFKGMAEKVGYLPVSQ